MKLRNEHFWIVLAFISVPFYFVNRETLEVKEGLVNAHQTIWWCKKTNAKSLNASSVGRVYIKSHGFTKSSQLISIDVLDNQGKLFWSLPYQGVNKAGRAGQDVDDLRRAIKTGSEFSATYFKSALWSGLIIVFSLFMYIYKRAWRLGRERQERNDPRSAFKDGVDKF